MKPPPPTPRTRYVALLRGVNVGGRRPVGMAALRDLLADSGFADVRSVLQSGNLVFSSEPRPADELERRLEAEAKNRLGLEADFLVRGGAEWGKIVKGNPMHDVADRDPGHLVAFCLKAVPARGAVEALRDAIVGREALQWAAGALFVAYPDGIGRSKLTHALIERKLGTRGTGRNWNTVLKLEAMVRAGEA